MVDSVIFDAEGVLIDTEELWDRGQDEFLGRHGVHYDRAALKRQLSGCSLEAGVEILRTLYDLSGETADLVRERREIMLRLLGEGNRWMPGALDFLELLAGSFKMAMATAMDPSLFAIVDAELGMTARFAGNVVTLDQVEGRGKPAPDLFLRAAAILGSVPAECVVVEDAPLGIDAAHRAGMTCVALATTYAPALLSRADLVVRSFSDLRPPMLTMLR